MKILVTGGTGRIGANLVKQLLRKGHAVRSFVYPSDASRAHKLDSYPGLALLKKKSHKKTRLHLEMQPGSGQRSDDLKSWSLKYASA